MYVFSRPSWPGSPIFQAGQSVLIPGIFLRAAAFVRYNDERTTDMSGRERNSYHFSR